MRRRSGSSPCGLEHGNDHDQEPDHDEPHCRHRVGFDTEEAG